MEATHATPHPEVLASVLSLNAQHWVRDRLAKVKNVVNTTTSPIMLFPCMLIDDDCMDAIVYTRSTNAMHVLYTVYVGEDIEKRTTPSFPLPA